MLAPEKHLKVNQFARDLVNGIIFKEVQDNKLRPEILKSHYFKHGIKEAMMKKVIDTALTSFAETPLTKGGNLEQAAEINITSRDDEL